MQQSPSWKANGSQPVKKFPAFYGTRRFVTAARHLSLSWARTIIPTSWKVTSILTSSLSLYPSCGLFPSGFPTETLSSSILSLTRSTFPAQILVLELITQIIHIMWEVQNIKLIHTQSSLVSVISSSLGPDILLSTLFSNTLSLRSSLSVMDQVSHPYKTTGKITVLYIFIFKFLVSKLEDSRFCTEWQQAFPEFNLLLLSSRMGLWFVKAVHKHLNSSTISKDLLLVFMVWFFPCKLVSSHDYLLWNCALLVCYAACGGTDVSGQPICPIFKAQEYPPHHCTLRNSPEERSSSRRRPGITRVLIFGFCASAPRTASLLATTKASVFLRYVCFQPVYWHHQHKPEVDACHLILSPPGSLWTLLTPYATAEVEKQWR